MSLQNDNACGCRGRRVLGCSIISGSSILWAAASIFLGDFKEAAVLLWVSELWRPFRHTSKNQFWFYTKRWSLQFYKIISLMQMYYITKYCKSLIFKNYIIYIIYVPWNPYSVNWVYWKKFQISVNQSVGHLHHQRKPSSLNVTSVDPSNTWSFYWNKLVLAAAEQTCPLLYYKTTCSPDGSSKLRAPELVLGFEIRHYL